MQTAVPAAATGGYVFDPATNTYYQLPGTVVGKKPSDVKILFLLFFNPLVPGVHQKFCLSMCGLLVDARH